MTFPFTITNSRVLGEGGSSEKTFHITVLAFKRKDRFMSSFTICTYSISFPPLTVLAGMGTILDHSGESGCPCLIPNQKCF